MNSKFPVLSFVSILLRLVGFIITLPGLYYAVWYGAIEPNLAGHGYGMENFYQLGGGVLALIIGLSLVAFGEIIGVLFAIEGNTRSNTAISVVH